MWEVPQLKQPGGVYRCGPCKMILPQLEVMAKEMEGRAHIVKFNCNKYNKELGISLGIKVAPTFLLYKNGEQVCPAPGSRTRCFPETDLCVF